MRESVDKRLKWRRILLSLKDILPLLVPKARLTVINRPDDVLQLLLPFGSAWPLLWCII
jgi:hypothetical protein